MQKRHIVKLALLKEKPYRVGKLLGDVTLERSVTVFGVARLLDDLVVAKLKSAYRRNTRGDYMRVIDSVLTALSTYSRGIEEKTVGGDIRGNNHAVGVVNVASICTYRGFLRHLILDLLLVLVEFEGLNKQNAESEKNEQNAHKNANYTCSFTHLGAWRSTFHIFALLSLIYRQTRADIQYYVPFFKSITSTECKCGRAYGIPTWQKP